LTPALKKWPLGHLNRPMVTGLRPFGARVHFLIGAATSVPHFGHLGMLHHQREGALRDLRVLLSSCPIQST